MSEIAIACDSTDHFQFWCEPCSNRTRNPVVMQIVMVESASVLVDSVRNKYDNCTRILAECPRCKTKNQRKIYWQDEWSPNYDRNTLDHD